MRNLNIFIQENVFENVVWKNGHPFCLGFSMLNLSPGVCGLWQAAIHVLAQIW